MPEYPFRSPDGEIVLLEFPMAEVPSIGEQITHKGVAFTRQVATHRTQVRSYKHISLQIDPKHPDAPRTVPHGASRAVAFESRREVEEFQAKNPQWKYS